MENVVICALHQPQRGLELKGEFNEKKMTFAAALLAATALGGVASAKTLVYCSEGSPEGFDPALYTAGTTFDASSRPVYNRLVEFKPGTTEIEPGLAESWTFPTTAWNTPSSCARA